VQGAVLSGGGQCPKSKGLAFTFPSSGFVLRRRLGGTGQLNAMKTLVPGRQASRRMHVIRRKGLG